MEEWKAFYALVWADDVETPGKGGWARLVVSAVVLPPFRGRGVDTVGTVGLVVCGIQCACMIGTVFVVERALRRHFRFGGRGKKE